MLIFLTFFPGPYQDFYRSSRGLLVVVIGAVWSVFGMFFLRRLTRRDAEGRVLGGSAAVVQERVG